MSGSSSTDAATVPEESGSTEAAPVVDGDATAAAQQPKTFLQKLQEIGYAPRELWIIYSIKFAESTAYFAFSYIYAPYLSDVFGFSDIEAGMLYAYYGVLCSVFGLLAGPVIDSLDLRSALLVGTIPSFAARFGSAVTDDPDFVSMCSISALPIGAAFGLPVFALGVRRYTHPENRAFAFTIFYAVLCASSAAGGLVITFARTYFHDGLILPWPVSLISPVEHLGWMRVNVLLCSGFTFYTCAAACMVRNARVQQDVPLAQAKLVFTPRRCCGARRSWPERKRVILHYLRVVYGDSSFWRLLVLSLIVALGTRATFRHLDATFPKYFMRTFGADAPFELFVAVEPIITVLLSFPVTFLLLRTRASTFTSLVGGTLLQSFCPIALVWTSYANALAFVVIMAAGEAIWSPKLYEYSTMVAPEGYEGTFVAVAFVPQYVSAGIVGVSSGLLLDRYVPRDDDLLPGTVRRPHMLWGLVAAASFVTPLMLVLMKRQLFQEEEAQPPPGRYAETPDSPSSNATPGAPGRGGVGGRLASGGGRGRGGGGGGTGGTGGRIRNGGGSRPASGGSKTAYAVAGGRVTAAEDDEDDEDDGAEFDDDGVEFDDEAYGGVGEEGVTSAAGVAGSAASSKGKGVHAAKRAGPAHKAAVSAVSLMSRGKARAGKERDRRGSEVAFLRDDDGADNDEGPDCMGNLGERC